MESLLAPHVDAPSAPACAAESPGLQLPLDFARSNSAGVLGARHAFALHLPLLTDVAPEALLIALFAAALSRYNGQESIPLLSSPQRDTGLTRSHALLQLRTSADVTLRELIAQVDVQRGAAPASPATTATATATIASCRAAISFVESNLFVAADAQQLLRALPAELRQVDLHWIVSDSGMRRQCALVYNALLFKTSSVARWAAHLEVMLSHVAAGSAALLDAPLLRLPLLTGPERDWLAAVGTGRQRALDAALAHETFEAHCAARPDAPALRFRDLTLTCAQLNRRANQLAHHLLAQGIGTGDAVIVCVEPSLEIAIALLAIFKAGAVYVALDPGYPPQRIRNILDDTQPRLVLTQSHLIERLALRGEPHLLLDTATALLDRYPTSNPALTLDASQPASIYYTSGTTGKPKGVVASQANVRAYLQLARERYQMGPADVVPALARFSFSISMFELMAPLTSGATLLILQRDQVLDLERLADTLSQVTFFHAGPSLLKNLLAHLREQPGAANRYDAVRHASSGGDMVAPEVLEALHQTFRNAEVFVIYGCSEISCMGCTYPAPRGVALTRSYVGRPFDNVSVRVLDAALNPLPAGIAGEICFAGSGVVSGYLNRPELTAEKFVDIDGQRFYRTGDMGRWSDDGWLEILGRNDFQVNVRGMRIEIAEVEYHLRKAPGVRDGLVMAKPAPGGEKALVAYLVAASGHAPGDAPALVAAVRGHMAQHLPDYMLPVAYVVLDALPLSPNGKVDRMALPAPDAQAFSGRSFDAPQGELEVALARIWGEVLGLEGIGRRDHFFDLGGHSLLATQVLSRVRRDLGLALALRTIFDHPVLADLGADLQRTSAEHSTQGASAPGTSLPAAGPTRIARRDAALPTTFSQRRMWLAQQLDPDTCAYHIWLSLRLTGALDAGALQQALDTVVQRHEAFRTHFEAQGDVPVQRIARPQLLRLSHIDLSSSAAAEREAQLNRVVHELTQARFDLAQPGAYRIALVRLAPSEHALHWVMHHAIGDQWSFGILLDELRRTYAALRDGAAQPLAPLRLDQADDAAWQLEQAQSEGRAAQFNHWCKRLAGLLPLPLPTDFVRRGALSGRGATLRARLTLALVAQLEQFSRSHGVTPFMTLIACFQVLLARLCSHSDIGVAVPVANRNHLHAESLVGSLINTLVLRSDLAGNPRFAELLAQVKETALQAYANQDTPFEQLAEHVQAPRDPLRAPLAQVMFNLVNAPFRIDGFPGLQVRPIEVDIGAAQFELALLVDLETLGECQLTYASELFSAASAERFLGAFMTLLQSVLGDPTQRIQHIPLLDSAQRAELARWNHTEREAPAQRNLAELLGGAASRWAEQPALQDSTLRLSHAELDARSNRLARALRARGIGRGALVGLAVERNHAMLVALLAILKSGAAYVPLDPAYPAQRLETMAADAQLALLVTQSAHAAALPWPRADSLWLDTDAREIDAQAGSALPPDPQRDAGPDDPAYVIYTSGSTGQPKGVVVPHRAVLNFLASMAQQPGLTCHDRVLAVTTLSFDIAVLELLLPLSVGACVILASAEQAVDGRALRDLLESSRATLMQATPSTWRMLIDAGWSGAPGFKALIGGEALPSDLAQALIARVGELWNMYGPTETTVWSTCWRVAPAEAAIRIGTPIANTQVHVLDAAQQPCLIGVPGEIYIGGAGVALGYLHRPELTGERFVPDLTDPQRRMYRTGDLGRWCHDGQLEHLGRLDHQVKIRGHRIELGEIEAQLAAHPGLSRNVIVAREDVPGDMRLVAYIVARAAAPAPTDLREHLRKTLPPYMLPQHFVVLDALPLLPNGKLDRSRLPAPTHTAVQAQPQPAPLESAPMRAIATVWTRLLGVQSVTASDNFFDLGGHSLLAMRAVSEIEQALGVRLSPRRLVFETLAQLAVTGAPEEAASPQTDRAAAPRGDAGAIRAWGARLRRLFFCG